MHVDFKVIVWERVQVPDTITKEDLLNQLQAGNITSSNSLFDLFEAGMDYEVLPETETQLPPDEGATIEAFEDGMGHPFWTNYKK